MFSATTSRVVEFSPASKLVYSYQFRFATADGLRFSAGGGGLELQLHLLVSVLF